MRQALRDARAALRLYRDTGLRGAFGPIDGARLAIDALAHKRGVGLGVVHAHAATDPLRPAVVSGELRLSYGELEARINRLTHALHALGVRTGDRVGLFLCNGHEYLELHLALSCLGAVGVQIGYRSRADEVAYIVSDASCKALFFHPALAPVVEEVVSRGQSDRKITHASAISTRPVSGFSHYEALLATGRADTPRTAEGDAWGGLMIYTSGTTGRGKGARRDFRKMGLSSVLGLLDQLPLRRDERHLVACPMYHSLAPMFAVPVVAVGGCLVIVEHFDAEATLATMARERVTSTAMVPTMLNRIVSLPDEVRFRHDTSALRFIMSGAAPLPTELAGRVEDLFGPVLYNVYGATETGLVTLALPGEHTARPGTIGRAIPGNSIRLLDEAGREVPEGEVGELYVQNGMLMDGYHGDANATDAATRDGHISVGDLARRDADGYYFIADRKIDLVISGGVNIYPFEIEQRLHQHPAVREAAVAGVPDDEWGETLVAWVALREGQTVTAEALIEFVRAELADYKRPRRVFFVDELPRNPTGKVLKRELRARFAARQEG